MHYCFVCFFFIVFFYFCYWLERRPLLCHKGFIWKYKALIKVWKLSTQSELSWRKPNTSNPAVALRQRRSKQSQIKFIYVFLKLPFIDVCSTQIASPLCLFTQRVLPLNSSHSAPNVHNALGNCCFPLPLRSHHFKTKLLCPLVYFLRPQPGQIPSGQLQQASGPVRTSKVPWKKKKNLLSWHKFVPVAWRSRKNVDGY